MLRGSCFFVFARRKNTRTPEEESLVSQESDPLINKGTQGNISKNKEIRKTSKKKNKKESGGQRRGGT